MGNLYDRHGILNLSAFPIQRHSDLRFNVECRKAGTEEINEFTFWRLLLNEDLDRYDKAILSMSDRIANYKRKLIDDYCNRLEVNAGRGVSLDEKLWLIHDKSPGDATFIFNRIRAMEEELNAFYQFKQTLVRIINEMLEYQFTFYEEHAAEMAHIIRDLHNARRDAHFWHGMAIDAMESDALMTRLLHDCLTKKN